MFNSSACYNGEFRTDSIKEPRNREIRLFASENILNAKVVQEITVSLTFGGNGIPKDGL